MTLRATKLQKAQLGLETTPGTEVAANLLARNTKIGLKFMGDAVEEYMAEGHLFPTDSSSGLKWGGGSWEAPPTFDESYLVFNSLFKHVNPTGAGVAKTRVWTPSVNAADTHDTYSVQRGMTGAVRKSAYTVFNTMKLLLGKRVRPLMSGDLLAQAVTLATALTSTPTNIKSSVIPRKNWNIYWATSWANLQSAPVLINPAKYELNYGPVLKDVALIGSTQPSWDALGPIVPKTGLGLVLPFDVSGSDLAGALTLSNEEAGDPIYIRAEAVGKLLETGTPNLYETLRIDGCFKARQVPDDDDIDGVFLGLAWELGLFVDSVTSKAIEATTISAT